MDKESVMSWKSSKEPIEEPIDKTSSPDREMAEAHWKFIESWLHMVYVDSFIHGWKHAREDIEARKHG